MLIDVGLFFLLCFSAKPVFSASEPWVLKHLIHLADEEESNNVSSKFDFLNVELALIELDDLDEDNQAHRPILDAVNLLINAVVDGISAPIPTALQGFSFKVKKAVPDMQGNVHHRLDQYVSGIRIYGGELIVHRFGTLVSSGYGGAVEAIPNDITGVFAIGTKLLDFGASAKPVDLDKSARIMQDGKDSICRSPDAVFREDRKETVVYIDWDKMTVGLGVELVFLGKLNDLTETSRPHRLVDADTEEIVFDYDALTTGSILGKGPGGNSKTGKYNYGEDRPKLPLTERNGKCYFETENIKTIKMDNGQGEEAFSFDCDGGRKPQDQDEHNEAYSSLNDGHFFAEMTLRMFNDWFQTRPFGEDVIPVKVHGPAKDQAEWNGEELVIYDGDKLFYPLTSLDVMAHEIAHGVTEKNSNLEYRSQSGALNEAFSDITGKAAEAYVRGVDKVVWEVGTDIMKEEGKAIRSMDDPVTDGKSISHVKDFEKSMDVHVSSGIFNRAFHLISEEAGFGIRNTFEMFYVANTQYWRSRTNFKKAAQTLLQSMAKMKEGRYMNGRDYSSCCDLEKAMESLKKVGIRCKHRRNTKYKCKV